MSQNDQTARPTVSDSRRRLIQGGIAGAPLLLMLKSAPALATYSCKQPSGFSVSGNLSRHGKDTDTCKPSYKHPSQWYAECTGTSKPWWWDKKVQHTLGYCGYNTAHNNKTMMDALNDGDEFLKYCAGAWANAKTGTYTVPDTEVCKMWGYGPSRSYLAVSYPTVKWGKGEITTYIKYTMGM